MNIYYRDKSFLGVDFHVGSHYWCVRDHSPINFVAEICFFVCCLLTHLCFFALPGLQFQRCWLTRPNNAFRSSFHFRLIVMVAFRKGNPFISRKSRSFGRWNVGPIWPDLTKRSVFFINLEGVFINATISPLRCGTLRNGHYSKGDGVPGRWGWTRVNQSSKWIHQFSSVKKFFPEK